MATASGEVKAAGLAEVGGGRFIACFPPVPAAQAVDFLRESRKAYSWPMTP